MVRAAALGRGALGDEGWQRLLTQGAALCSADLAALAFPRDGS